MRSSCERKQKKWMWKLWDRIKKALPSRRLKFALPRLRSQFASCLLLVRKKHICTWIGSEHVDFSFDTRESCLSANVNPTWDSLLPLSSNGLYVYQLKWIQLFIVASVIFTTVFMSIFMDHCPLNIFYSPFIPLVLGNNPVSFFFNSKAWTPYGTMALIGSFGNKVTQIQSLQSDGSCHNHSMKTIIISRLFSHQEWRWFRRVPASLLVRSNYLESFSEPN